MTNEQAIEIITLMYDMANNSVSTNTSNAEALDMAIRALKNEQTCNDSDLISRELAKQMIRDKFKGLPERVEINTVLNEVPSVKTDEDLIPRQAVITMLNKIENAVEDGDGFQFNEWIEYAKQIPSFENMASWVELDDYPCEDWECDNCGFIITGVVEPYRFCPNCGKKMWK